MDTRVTLLERSDNLWTRAVGSEMGRFFEAFLRDWGVHVRTRTTAERLKGGDTVEAVVLGDGTRLHADLVVIGVGVRPDTGLAERAGLPVDDGILVDRQLRAGDGGWVASAEHPRFGRVRIEHWAEALNQGLLAGRNLAGVAQSRASQDPLVKLGRAWRPGGRAVRRHGLGTGGRSGPA
jgi:3-phenylpropionate/trans-cinnamate dioxygenase ferredoxin reductase subunit